MAERYAVYYAPPATGKLWERASRWLGYDAASGENHEGGIAGIDRDRLLNLTGTPGRYGFHATLRAPMHLAPGLGRAELDAAVAELTRGHAPIPLGRLRLDASAGFLALVPEAPHEAIGRFAFDVVEALEPLRAPLGERDRARRLAEAPLDARQTALLDAYGYPYVAEQFYFHMTLSDRIAPETAEETIAAAQTWFGPMLDQEIVLDRVGVFVEPEPGHSFRRGPDHLLG